MVQVFASLCTLTAISFY